MNVSLNLDKSFDIGGLNLQAIEVLNIVSKKTVNIPEWVFHLPHLKTLYLNMDKLTEIDERIFEMTTLENLTLKNTQIKMIQIPKEHKTKLKNLNLTHNALQALPQGLEYLNKLELLNISNNPIAKCDFSFFKLSHLKFLYADRVGFVLDQKALTEHPSLRVISNDK